MSTKAEARFDLEHTYEFINRGEPWKRPDSEEDEVVATGGSFRARSNELKVIEKEGDERFEHVRTLPFPPADLAKRARRVSGMQRKEPKKLEQSKS